MWRVLVNKPSCEGPSLSVHMVLTMGSSSITSTSFPYVTAAGQRCSFTPSIPLRKGLAQKKICNMAGLGAGFGAGMSRPVLRQPQGQAAPHAADRVEIGAADMWKKEPALKSVWSSLLGKAGEKPRKAASLGGRGAFLDAILFLMLSLSNNAVSRRA